MRGPRVYQLNFIIKRKKGGSQPQKPSIRVPTASDMHTDRIKDGADAAAFETIRTVLDVSMHCLQCT